MSKKEEHTGSVEIIKAIDPRSKQASDSKNTVGVRTPIIPFTTLTDLYYNSFVVAWLTDKIATAIASGFTTKDDGLMKVLKGIDQEFMNRNKVLCWNAFFEVIRDKSGKGKVVELLPILSNTIQVMQDGDWYRQQIGTEVVYFNAFTPMDKRAEKEAIYASSKAWANELTNTGKGCGFNPNLNEVYQFKNTSLSTKYYGASYYESVIDQLILIEQIDKFYSKGFDNGMIKAKMIFPKWEKAKFTKEDKLALKEFIKSKMKGVDKAFATAILDNEVGQLDLEHDIDAKAFLEYRTQLLQSVAIALNVPYDMLLSDNSNRASSQVSLETFNQFTIYPAQQQNIKDFKILFAEDYKVDDLDYNFIDTKDEKEEMEILTGYKKSGIMTANEVRARLWLEAKDGWDELKTESVANAQAQGQASADAVIKAEAGEFFETLTKIENDLFGNIQTQDKKGNWKTV